MTYKMGVVELFREIQQEHGRNSSVADLFNPLRFNVVGVQLARPQRTLKVAGSRKVLYFLRLLPGYVCLHLVLKTLTQKLDLDSHRLFHMDHGGALCAATSLNV